MPYIGVDGEEMFEVEISLKRTLKSGEIQHITGIGIADAKDVTLNYLSAHGYYIQERERPADPMPPGTSMVVIIQNYAGVIRLTKIAENLSTHNDTAQ